MQITGSSGKKPAPIRLLKSWMFFVLLFLLFYMIVPPGGMANPLAAKIVGTGDKAETAATDQPAKGLESLSTVELYEHLARLSDDRVRSLLIAELESRSPKQKTEDVGFLVGLITRIKDWVMTARDRVEMLRSGKSTYLVDVPEALKGATDVRVHPPLYVTLTKVVGVFAAGFFVNLLVMFALSGVRGQVKNTPAQAPWSIKSWHLCQQAALDLLSIIIISGVILVLFFTFFDDGSSQARLFMLGYLIAILVVGTIRLLSKAVLVPKVPALRYLPISDGIARYLHLWIVWIASVGAFGWLTCGLLRLRSSSEIGHLSMVILVGLAIAVMVVTMILQKREPVREILAGSFSNMGLLSHLAAGWHKLAILYVFGLWFMWAVLVLLAGPKVVVPAVASLLSLPAYFVIDNLLQKILKAAFSFASPSETVKTAEALQKTAETESGSGDGDEAGPKKIDVNRLFTVLRRALRVVLAVFIFFWLLGLWGVDVAIGTALARGAFSIIITILASYVAWVLINIPIERKLREEMPDDEEELEEGGSGGSRIGTLLVLLQKFILSVLVVMVTLILLSALGVDIGPLIAGAGVIGLAIGFGAQALVKDIISGVFFLIDDAFRVGDYVEAAGVKGMVEKISLRSMKLRHPRGMVNTIPFGSMGTVKNFSRDYIITKLDFRVRYDADVVKIKKIIKKKVYKEILKNEELASKLLSPIKSQGVREMGDSAMMMRVKFKSIPGEQFVLRKEVFRLMQEAFRKNGIEFAHKNVTVYLPPETRERIKERPDISEEKVIEAAAGAAAVQAEEEAAQAAKPEKKG